MRTAWKGSIRLANLEVAIKAYSAARTSSIAFVAYHRECPCEGLTKLEQHKWCKSCGTEVNKNEVGRAYEHGNALIPISDEELNGCKVETMVGMTIHHFIPKTFISLRYSERSYYITPDEGGEALIDAMGQALTNRIGIGELVLQNRVRPAMLESDNGHLILHLMHDASALRKPDDITNRDKSVDNKHVTLLRKLMKKMEIADPSEWTPRPDPYREALTALINDKVSKNVLVTETSATVAGPAPKSDSLAEQLRKALAGS